MQAATVDEAQPSIDEISSQPSSIASSQQIEEMMKLLRESQANQSGAGHCAIAYQSGASFFKSPSLPPCNPPSCHRALKWARRNLTMIGLTLLVITFLELSHGSNSSNEFSNPSPQNIMASFSIGSTKDETLYYNTKKGAEDKALPLAGTYDLKSVICILVTDNGKDVSDLLVALQSLAFLQGDSELPSPVLIFNENNLSVSQIEAIRTSTNRPITFPTVNITTLPPFPPGFPDYTVSVADRKPWSYYQRIRFFSTIIWSHPSVERYETIMRLDPDSCFKAPNSYLPRMMFDHIDYHAPYIGVEPEDGTYLEGLFDFIVEHMDRVHKSPGNVMLWHFIETTWRLGNTLPALRTNLELSKRSYMLRSDLQRWRNTLTEEEPYALFRHGWGESTIRFLEAAVFATDNNVLTDQHEGYHYDNRECSMVEVQLALKHYKIR